jgi:STE24 endopeptidase
MSSSAILYAFVAVTLIDLGWTLFLMALNYRETARHRGELPVGFASGISAGEAEKSSDYSLAKMRLSFIETSLSVLLTTALAVSGAFAAYDTLLAQGIASAYWRAAAFFGGILFISSALSAPANLYGTFVIEKRFGFNTTTLRTWLLDGLKGFLVGAAIGLPLLFLLYLFMDGAGGTWWLWASLIFSGIQVIVSLLYPLVIAPLFNKFAPLQDGRLKDRIRELAARLDFGYGSVYVMDGSKRSRHSNAYFTGMGRLKRIVLFDTLIAQMDEDEILSVLAHEIGHQKKRHILKMTILASGLGVLGFWALDLCMGWNAMYEAFGFAAPSRHALLLIVGLASDPLAFFLTPCLSALSRTFEYEADTFAAAATSSEALGSALTKLNVENASNLWPHRLYAAWYYSHPQLRERLAAIKK